jgi:hypothetical protein
MNISQKMPLVKTNLKWVIEHDDAPEKNVANAVAELHEFIDATWQQSLARRAARDAAAAKPTL